MTTGADNKKLAIIDGKSVFYRGYYAMPGLSLRDGTPTGGVYGFASIALEVMKKLRPDYACVAWDKPKTNIRKRLEIYPKYKAGRKPPPDDFYEQIPLLHELLEGFGWPLYELDDYEADDIMGALAVQATAQGIDTMLVTSDLDLLQLVHPKVHVYAAKKGFSSIDLYTPDLFIEKYGIRPEQFLDLKSLMGDSSDNIPGVPGIGKKGATDLLKEYETLDNIYSNLDLLKGSVHKKLVEGKESAYLSKKLASLWVDAPIKLDLEKLDIANCEPKRVKEVLDKLEFRSLVRQLPEAMQVVEASEVKEILDNGLSPIKLTPLKKAVDLKTVDYSKGCVTHYCLKDGMIDKLAIASKNSQEALLVDFKIHRPVEVITYLSKNETFQKSEFVVTFDLKKLLTSFGGATSLDLTGLFQKLNCIDLHVSGFLLNPLRRDHTIASLARDHLSLETEAGELDQLESLGLNLAVLQKLHPVLMNELKSPENGKLWDVLVNIDMPVVPILAAMEARGMKLDVEHFETMSEHLKDKIIEIEQDIYGYADEEFNIASPAQLSQILFNKLKLPTRGIKRGKTAYSTAAGELEKLINEHEIIERIIHYREYTKLQNTYVETLPKLVDEYSRVHTTFNMTITQTGRLSSTDPNLQNIPVRSELGKQIREGFIADKGNVLISADYSQFELRLAAYLAGDTELIELFNKDVDIHTSTASQIYDRTPEEITKTMRRDAKVINFGILYGMSSHGLSVATGMNREAAQKFIDKYFELRKPLLDYMEHLKEKARSDGYVETLFGRRRPMPDIKSSNYLVRSAAERAAINMPIQGTESDLMKLAMQKIEEKLPEEAHQIMQVHDSIMVECPEEISENVAKIMKFQMENIYKLPVKLTVEVAIGKNWSEV
jgi:DNA polymerase I